jgi:hypothetical protein
MDFTAQSMSSHENPIIQPLNPCDYFTLAMDEEIRSEGMPGSLCGFAIELKQCPDVAVLNERIAEFSQQFPLILASLQQHRKRFYWCQRPEPPQVFFQHDCPKTENEAQFQQTLIEELINEKQSREAILPLTFHLISGATKATFFLRWIHPLCDAVGIDLILRYLCTDDAEKRQLFDLPKSEPLIHLQLKKYNLWQKIKLFSKAYRYISELDKQRSIIHAKNLPPQRLRLLTYKLTAQQTQMIANLTRQNTGLTGTSLYYIGCLMRALEKMNPQQTGDAYCVPYAFNLRKQKALSPVLGNQVGALFAQAPRSLLANREALFTHLKQQNANVIRQQLDFAFLPVMWAASWLSLKKHGENLRHSYTHQTERSSCLFSNVNLSDLSNQRLLGCEISGFFHLCQISSPPGLALLTCHYQQQLTLSYNYIEPLFDEDWIERLHDFMLQELLGEA